MQENPKPRHFFRSDFVETSKASSKKVRGKTKNRNLVLGIDEAGRGPVIGPLVIAGVNLRKSDFFKLKKLGVKDSKLLLPKKRERLEKEIKKSAKNFWIRRINPLSLDKENINKLCIKKEAQIIKQSKAKEVIIDAPVANTAISLYLKRIRLFAPGNYKLIGKNNAEKFSLAVAAASILAKVERDRIIKKLRKKYGDFGSGYTSDKKTKNFLKSHQNRTLEIVRKKWDTVKRYHHGTS